MKDDRSGWDIISGVVYILFGLMMLIGGAETRIAGILVMEIFISVWAIFAGFGHLFQSFALKKAGVKNWIWTLVGSILMIVLGCLFLIMPFMGVVVMVGVAAIYASIVLIIGGFTGLAFILSGSGSKESESE